MSRLPRKAAELIATLQRLAVDPGASENEARMARVEIERLLRHHGLSAAPEAPTPASRRTRRLGSGQSAQDHTDAMRREPAATLDDTPLRVLPPVAVVGPGEDWAIALGASVAEAVGARLLRSEGPAGVCLSFAGAGADPELASASFRLLHDQAKGRSAAWRDGFAAAVDERLDRTIEEPAVRARVKRVIAWLDADPFTARGGQAPALDVDHDEGQLGAEAGWVAV